MPNIGLIAWIMQNMSILVPCGKHGIWIFLLHEKQDELLAYNAEFMLLTHRKNGKQPKNRFGHFG